MLLFLNTYSHHNSLWIAHRVVNCSVGINNVHNAHRIVMDCGMCCNVFGNNRNVVVY
jgi:hypothetical protein